MVLPGAYHSRKQSTTASRVKCRTVVLRAQNRRAQRMSAPKILGKHFMRQRFRIVFLHLDLFEHHLLFLADVFLGEKRAQHQVGKHVKGDGQVLVEHLGIEATVSFAVKASSRPPTESISRAIMFGGAARGALENHVFDEVGDAVQRAGFPGATRRAAKFQSKPSARAA